MPVKNECPNCGHTYDHPDHTITIEIDEYLALLEAKAALAEKTGAITPDSRLTHNISNAEFARQIRKHWDIPSDKEG